MKLSNVNRAIKQASKFLWQSLTYGPVRMGYVGGWHGYGNLGDNALFAAANIIFHKCKLVEYPGGIAIKTLSRICQRTEIGVLGGGTLINRNDKWLRIAQEYMDGHKGLFVFGTGVANPSFWTSNPRWKNSLPKWRPILEKCKYVGVRGPLSAELLSDMGVDNVDVIGDPVLTFAKDRLAEDNMFLKDSVGLNISNDGHGQWGSTEKFQQEYVRFARMAKEAGWQVKWIVVQPVDLPLTRHIAEQSETDNEIYEIYDDHNLYMDLVGSLSTFAGTKLHAVVLATCAYVPSLMLEYRPKCRDYMKSIGQEHMTIRSDEFHAGKAWEILNNLNANRQTVSKDLYESIRPLREKQKTKAEELMNDLAGQ